MKIKLFFLIILMSSLSAAGLVKAGFIKSPVSQESMSVENLGEVTITTPLWGSKGLVLVFADSKKYPPTQLGRQIASYGVDSILINTDSYLGSFNDESGQCLDSQHIAATFDSIKGLSAEPLLIVAGVEMGALIPFVSAQSETKASMANLSIDFSVNLPEKLVLCPPFVTEHAKKQHRLVSAPVLVAEWRAVWPDQPADETALFVRAMGNVDTRIAAYDTPLDTLLLSEIDNILNQNKPDAPSMPVVENQTTQTNDTLTLFYSGDGGWRDLDRTVAEAMVKQNYPVVGVDVLRYFWEHKSPDQAAEDLSHSMAYYRQKWGVKNFVLAGYSFGADILPALYNRLPKSEQDSVKLLVLLALGQQADFEIHVSGWLGQSGNEESLVPELSALPRQKILCVYGLEEKSETACTTLQNTAADVLALPGGHHFDENYPKLTSQILDVYKQHGIN